jgi:hypothetical protein
MNKTADDIWFERLQFITKYAWELNEDHDLDFEVSSQGETITVSSKMLGLNHDKIDDIAGYFLMKGVRYGIEMLQS